MTGQIIKKEANRVISCKCKVRLVIEIHCVAVGAVDDVLDAPAVGHQGLMVAVVGWEEDALALGIVGCDEPSDIRQSFAGEFGEGAGGCVDVVCVGHCELVEGLIDGVRGLFPDTFIAQGSRILTIGTSLSGVREVPELRSLIDSCMGQSITWMLGGGMANSVSCIVSEPLFIYQSLAACADVRCIAADSDPCSMTF